MGSVTMKAMQQSSRMLFDAFLEWVAGQELKHEYIDGQIYAMAGAQVAHVRVCGNLHAEFRNHLRGSPCASYASDLMVRVEAANCGFYPDVLVTCEKFANDNLLSYAPQLIVEVLSPSTERYDKTDKFNYYRQLESLEEFVLVDTMRHALMVYRKIRPEEWLLRIYRGDQSAEFKSIGLALPLEIIFEGIE
jgi:Uma2 family endonuclease